MGIRLGIIGAGAIGKAHAAAAAAVGQTVAAIADLDLATAELLAESVPGAAATDSPEALFADASLDAVVIGVPNRWHKDLAIAAMQAGKDVLLEKPMGLNAAQCREINAVATATKRILQIGMVYRFSAAAQAAKSFVAAGELGEIYHGKAHLYRRRGVPGLGGWFTTKAISGGGPLIDLGVHLVDLACWLMDFPAATRVSGKTYSYFGRRMGDYVFEEMWAGPPKLDGVCDVEDSAHALIHFEGGATLDLHVSWAINLPTHQLAGTDTIALVGDRGGLSFSLRGDELQVASERHRHNVDTQVTLPEVDPMEQQLAAFAHSVQTREPPLADGCQAEQVQAIIDAIYESSESEAEVRLPR